MQRGWAHRAASVKAPPGVIDRGPGVYRVCQACPREGPLSPNSALNQAGSSLPRDSGGAYLELVLAGGQFPGTSRTWWAQAMLQVMHGDKLAGCKGTAPMYFEYRGHVSQTPPCPSALTH